MNIMKMTKENLLNLSPEMVDRLLMPDEVIHLAELLGALWRYDYEASLQGRLGMHAVLKSDRHSDGFFVSRILLQSPKVRRLFANQLVLRFNQLNIPKPDRIAGIPDGATELGKDVAKIMGVKNAHMKKKEDECIELTSPIGRGRSLLLVEDFCTRGTGFKEAVCDIVSKQPQVRIPPYELVILNRGGLDKITVEGAGSFRIVSVVEYRMDDWPPEECPLCQRGSIPIKPKATDKNWELITTSQLA